MQPEQTAPQAKEYASWQISDERHRYEWTQWRRTIVSARLRFVVFGHAAYFGGCFLLNNAGMPCSNFMFTGGWSLLFASFCLFVLEYFHVRALPRTPARFVIRTSGLTEYGEEGPQTHWEWHRARHLSIATDCNRPAYRSLIVAIHSESRFIRAFSRISIPLPELEERDIVAAVQQALEANHIELRPQSGGNVALVSHNPKPII